MSTVIQDVELSSEEAESFYQTNIESLQKEITSLEGEMRRVEERGPPIKVIRAKSDGAELNIGFVYADGTKRYFFTH